MTERRYSLEIDQTHAEVLVRATDMYSRIHTGQFDAIIGEFIGINLPVEALDEARVLLARVQELLTGAKPIGILDPKVRDSARIAFDLQQVIRCGIEVEPHEPINASFTCGLPVIHKITPSDDQDPSS